METAEDVDQQAEYLPCVHNALHWIRSTMATMMVHPAIPAFGRWRQEHEKLCSEHLYSKCEDLGFSGWAPPVFR